MSKDIHIQYNSYFIVHLLLYLIFAINNCSYYGEGRLMWSLYDQGFLILLTDEKGLVGILRTHNNTMCNVITKSGLNINFDQIKDFNYIYMCVS